MSDETLKAFGGLLQRQHRGDIPYLIQDILEYQLRASVIAAVPSSSPLTCGNVGTRITGLHEARQVSWPQRLRAETAFLEGSITCQGLGLANGRAGPRTPGPQSLGQNIFHGAPLGPSCHPRGVIQKLVLKAPEAQAGGSPRPVSSSERCKSRISPLCQLFIGVGLPSGASTLLEDKGTCIQASTGGLCSSKSSI